jgi:hypothetical protein
MTPVSDEILIQAVEAVQTHATKQAAADSLGWTRETLRDRYRVAVKRNLTGDALGGALPEGYHLGKVTSLVSPDGTVMEWQHKLPDADRLDTLFETLSETFKAEMKPLPALPWNDLIPVVETWLTLYPVVDAHLGQYSWAKQTGENYDLDIARQQFLDNTTSLYQLTPASGTALIVVLGDYFHADNDRAETERTHNHLDVDGRFDKVLHMGAELLLWHVDMALQKHETVIVKVMRGNHDPYASKALTLALWVRYQNNPRVVIDRTPVDLWAIEWGRNMLSFTHGDNVKAEEMPGVMAAYYPEMWGLTKYRYGFSGHYHRTKKGPLSDEKHGAIWEIIPAFTAKDAWNRSMGHSSQRSIQAITFDKNTGRKFTTYVNIGEAK